MRGWPQHWREHARPIPRRGWRNPTQVTPTTRTSSTRRTGCAYGSTSTMVGAGSEGSTKRTTNSDASLGTSTKKKKKKSQKKEHKNEIQCRDKDLGRSTQTSQDGGVAQEVRGPTKCQDAAKAHVGRGSTRYKDATKTTALSMTRFTWCLGPMLLLAGLPAATAAGTCTTSALEAIITSPSGFPAIGARAHGGGIRAGSGPLETTQASASADEEALPLSLCPYSCLAWQLGLLGGAWFLHCVIPYLLQVFHRQAKGPKTPHRKTRKRVPPKINLKRSAEKLLASRWIIVAGLLCHHVVPARWVGGRRRHWTRFKKNQTLYRRTLGQPVCLKFLTPYADEWGRFTQVARALPTPLLAWRCRRRRLDQKATAGKPAARGLTKAHLQRHAGRGRWPRGLYGSTQMRLVPTSGVRPRGVGHGAVP